MRVAITGLFNNGRPLASASAFASAFASALAYALAYALDSAYVYAIRLPRRGS